MGYGVMRCEKRKRDAIGGIQKENCRTKEQHEQGLELDNSEIDWERTAYNNYLIQNKNWHHTVTDRLKEIEKETGKKTRKDAVTMIDTLFSASREFFDLPPYDENNREEYLTALRDKLAGMTPEERQAYFDSCNKYFEECLDFYIKEFCQGDRSRVISAVVHYDEATPHLHVTSVPILTTEAGNRLNAKVIMGGVNDYRHHQDRFFSEVSSRYGLERGETRAPAEAKVHTTKKEWQIAKQQETLDKNAEVLQRQVAQYNAAKKAIEEQGRILQDTKDKIETLSNEALQNIKVNRASDLFNRDTVTVDRESYASLSEAVKAIGKEADTITAAENISQKKAELKAVTAQITAAKRELAAAEFDRDSVQAEYDRMRSFVDDNKSGLQLHMENARLQSENEQLKQENSLLKKAVGAINKFAQEHPALVPDFIRKELAKLSAPTKEKHRGFSI